MYGLVIDSDEPVRDLICACLRRAGLEVVGAADAAGARKAIAERRPAYLVVDEGSCSSSEWRALSDGGARPSLLLCGDPGAGWAREHGLPRVGKPFGPPELVMRVRVWLLDCGLLARTRRLMPEQPGAVVLDVCSGSGASSCEAADAHGPTAVVVGIDRSHAAVRRAHEDTRRLGYENLLWVVGDAARLPFRSRAFSAAWRADGLRFVERPDAAAAEVRRVLR